MNQKFENLIFETQEKYSPSELALGFLRYEALRKLNPREFTELYQKNIKSEIIFDAAIDELIIQSSVK